MNSWIKLFPVITEGYVVYQFNETEERFAGGFVLLPRQEPIIKIDPSFEKQSLGYLIKQFINDVKPRN